MAFHLFMTTLLGNGRCSDCCYPPRDDTHRPLGRRSTATSALGLGQANAIKDANPFVVQLDAGPVRVAQIEAVLDAAVRPEIFDARLVQLSPGRLEVFVIDR